MSVVRTPEWRAAVLGLRATPAAKLLCAFCLINTADPVRVRRGDVKPALTTQDGQAVCIDHISFPEVT